MSNKWTPVEDPCDTACNGSSGNCEQGPPGPQGLPGPPGAGTDLTIEESVTSCGRSVQFSGDDPIFTLSLNDKRLVNETAHGLGAAGTIVALKPGTPAGTYDLAQANSALNVATHVGYVVDANSYILLSPGFYTFPNHGYTVGAHYTVSATTPGAFSLTVDAEESHYLQNAFHVETANCIFVNLQEAMPPSSGECCNTITKNNHGFSVGQIVASVGGVWSLAVADTPGAIMVTSIVDNNTFKVGHSACLSGIADIIAGRSYVVSPSTPGAIVSVATLDYSENDPYRPVGTGLSNGCLLVNMSPAWMYLCDCEGGGGIDPDPELDDFILLTFTTGESCGFDELPDDSFQWEGRGPYFSSAGVGDSCAFQSNLPSGSSEGRGQYAVYRTVDTKECLIFSVDVLVNNVTDVVNYEVIEFRQVDGGGTWEGVLARLELTPGSSIRLVLYSDPGVTLSEVVSSGVTPVADTWYRVSGIITMNTVGNSDGTVELRVDVLDGDGTSGSTGAISSTPYNAVTSSLEFANTVDGFNWFQLSGYIGGNTSPTTVTMLIDNFLLANCP